MINEQDSCGHAAADNCGCVLAFCSGPPLVPQAPRDLKRAKKLALVVPLPESLPAKQKEKFRALVDQANAEVAAEIAEGRALGLSYEQIALCSRTGADVRTFARVRREMAPRRARKMPPLTREQLQICAETGCTPEAFTALRFGAGV